MSNGDKQSFDVILPNKKEPKKVKCTKCNGTGKIGETTCDKCGGSGEVEMLED